MSDDRDAEQLINETIEFWEQEKDGLKEMPDEFIYACALDQIMDYIDGAKSGEGIGTRDLLSIEQIIQEELTE